MDLYITYQTRMWKHRKLHLNRYDMVHLRGGKVYLLAGFCSFRPFRSRMPKSRGQELWRVSGSGAALCLVYWGGEWPQKLSLPFFFSQGSCDPVYCLGRRRLQFTMLSSVLLFECCSLGDAMLFKGPISKLFDCINYRYNRWIWPTDESILDMLRSWKWRV